MNKSLSLLLTVLRIWRAERTNNYEKKVKMFELYGMNKDGMVYRSPPPRRKEVDILEVIRKNWSI